MKKTKNQTSPITNEQAVILTELKTWLSMIGSANDAEDHGYHADAEEMRRDACAAIRQVICGHEFLLNRIPNLQSELDSQHILGFGWSDLYHAVDDLLMRGGYGELSEASDTENACSICSQLKDIETAFQKYGWEENDTALPEEAGKLVFVRDLKPVSSRTLQLQKCPVCGTYYLYSTDYEYLVNGSEDEQRLERITHEQALVYLGE